MDTPSSFRLAQQIAAPGEHGFHSNPAIPILAPVRMSQLNQLTSATSQGMAGFVITNRRGQAGTSRPTSISY
jgi:hypothetical protein